MDTMTKQERSALMRRIRGDALGPESRFAAALSRAGEDPFRNVVDMPGRPDFVLEREDVCLAVFVHGCFWHCCPRHWRMPKTRVKFWAAKFAANTARDRRVRRMLRDRFCRTAVVWEHDLKSDAAADRVAARLLRKIE